MRRLWLGCAVVVACVAITPAMASARTFQSHVFFDAFRCEGGPGTEQCIAFGHVTSPHAKCKPNRKVKLFRDGDFVGSDRTSAHGFWGVRFPGVDGSYRARVTRRVLRNGDVCRSAVSEPVNITFNV